MELNGSMIKRKNLPQSTMGRWENLMDKTETGKITRCNSQKSLENINSQRTIHPDREVYDHIT